MTGTTNRAVKGAAAGALGVFIFLAASASLYAEPRQTAEPQGLAAGPLLAQAAPGATSPAPSTPSQPAHPHRMHARRHGMQGPADPMTYVEARISELHKRLHITPEQEPQFKAYADVMRGNAQAMRDLFQQRAQGGGENALDRLHWYAKLTAAHADGVSKLVPSFEALYQSLSDKQKKAADAEFRQIRQRRPAHRAG